jgi:hypothetical protein
VSTVFSLFRCRGGRKIGIPELKVLSRAMTAWQARVREYRRKKERLQLAQEFRNKTLLWQAFSRWMHFQVEIVTHTVAALCSHRVPLSRPSRL